MLQPITVQHYWAYVIFDYSDAIPDFTVKIIKILLFSPQDFEVAKYGVLEKISLSVIVRECRRISR